MSNTKPGPSRGNGKLPNGAKLVYGQMHLRPERQGRSAPEGFGRYDSLPKAHTITEPAISHGMKRQTKPSHEFLHGAPVQDEPPEKHFVGKGNVPTHPGMITTHVTDDPRRGSHDPQLGNAILQEAGRLGAPIGGWRK